MALYSIQEQVDAEPESRTHRKSKMNKIEVQDISFAYEGTGRKVLSHISCHFEAHTINLLMGESGAGKSTLLYCLNRVIPALIEGPFTGEIRLDGQSISDRPVQELSGRIGLVFQNPDSQFCTFTVEEELAFALENQCLAIDLIDRKIDEILGAIGMRAYRSCLLDALSGGQKQKVAIASILIQEPEVLLLDEPSANLDGGSRREILRLIETLAGALGKTVILIEHNLEDVFLKCGHVVLLCDGGSRILEGAPLPVANAVLYDAAYRDVSIKLPEKYLLMRQIMRRGADCAAIRDFADKRAGRETMDIDADYRALAALYERQAPKTDNGSGAKQEQDGSKIRVSRTAKSTDEHAAESADTKLLLCGQDIHFSYKDETEVLCGLDLTLHAGDFLAILGENGAGKSTLVHLLFRVYEKAGGSITLEGHPLEKIPKRELYRRMGLVFQNPEAQFVRNQVDEELRFGIRQIEADPAKRERLVDEILDTFHLREGRTLSPFELSQGQKRALSVATMLLTGQNILFFDEPTYGQDEGSQAELMELIEGLRRKGKTIVMITHDMELVAEYATKVLLLKDGRALFTGSPDALFRDQALLGAGRLAAPKVYALAAALQRDFPGIPVCGSRKAICDAIIRNITES